MSEKSSDAATGDMRPGGDVSDQKVEGSDQNGRDGMPSLQQEEAVIKKKYGGRGIMPRKTPLISKVTIIDPHLIDSCSRSCISFSHGWHCPLSIFPSASEQTWQAELQP